MQTEKSRTAARKRMQEYRTRQATENRQECCRETRIELGRYVSIWPVVVLVKLQGKMAFFTLLA